MRCRPKASFVSFALLVLAVQRAQTQQCRLCENGTYCFLETQFICPDNSRSQPGSGNITDCVCIPGFYATESHACRPCEPGFFCPGDERQVACPAHSLSDIFAVSATDCFCVAGFSGTSDACAACQPGSAKPVNGSAACVLCASGKYQDAPAESACTTCPTHTRTPGVTGSDAATACVSDPGYFSDPANGMLTPCAAGTFQPLANQTACTDCLRGNAENRFYTLNNASTSEVACLVCPDYSEVAGAASGHGIHSCECSAGFTGPNGGVCLPCAPGLVKAGVGSHTCDECPANEFADPSNSECWNCTGNSTSLAGSDNRSACACDAGFALNLLAPFDCQECAAGERAVDSGGLPVCEACPAGEYNDVRSQTACTPCPANEYQPASGQVACLQCPASSVSLEGAVERSECACLPGYTREIDECQMCLPGSYKNNTDNTACLPCAAGQTSVNASTSAAQCQDCAPQFLASSEQGLECQSCPANAVAALGGIGISSCECAPGFTGLSTNCEPCASGTFKPLAGAHNCTRCALGYAGVNISSAVRTSEATCVACAKDFYEEFETCQPCPSNAVSVEGSDSIYMCTCVAGYTPGPEGVQFGGCVACQAGLFKPSKGNVGCTLCGNKTFSTELAAINASTCQACPNNTAQIDDARNDIDTCVCLAGYEASTSGVACAACQDGSFKVLAGSVLCDQCVADTYQPYSSALHLADTCVSCPANSKSPSGAVTEEACVCLGQFHRNGSTCELCKNDHYCPDQDTVTVCPAHMTAPLGSVALGNCTCVPGYFRVRDTCQMCGANTYCADGVVQSACQINSTTHGQLGRVNRSACGCDRGFHKTCPCPPPVSLSLFRGKGIEPQVTLWDNAGIHTWLVAAFNQDCTKACSATGLVCTNKLHQNVFEAMNRAIMPVVMIQIAKMMQQTNLRCNNAIYWSSDARAPVVHVTQYATDCYPHDYVKNVNPFTCAGREGNTQRLCPCALTANQPPPLSTCECEAGSIDGVCNLCGEDTFCADNGQFTCTPNSSALVGAGSEAECLCDALFRRNGSVCVLCPSTDICPAGGGEIRTCAAGASNIDQHCKCAAGSYCSQNSSVSCLDTHSCLACEPGSYCLDNQQMLCKPGSDSPANSTSAASCRCIDGFYLSGKGTCIECPVGSYCANESLTDCATHDAVLTTENLGASLKRQCVCNAGHFRLTLLDLCKPCPQNFFCPLASRAELPNVVACPAEAFTRGSGHQVLSDCQFCDADHVLDPLALSICVCPRGSEKDAQGSCVACLFPKMKAIDSANSCGLCDANFVWLNSTSCASCPLQAISAPGDSACVCLPPLRMTNGTCTACQANSYLPSAGAACVACPAHSSTLGLENTLVVPGVASCLCDAGYVRAGQGAEFTGALCSPCPVATYESNGSCLRCPDQSTSSAASFDPSACGCNASLCMQTVWRGQICSGECENMPEPCEACLVGKFKSNASGVGNIEECEFCAQHSYQAASGAETCIACDASRHTQEPGSFTSDACQCVAGMEHVAGVQACRQCKPGHFKTERGDYNCSGCALGTFAPNEASTTCVSCAVFSQIRNANATEHMASQSVQNCTCDMGWYLDASGCVPCAVGSFKDHVSAMACSFCGSTVLGSNMLHNTYGVGLVGAISHSHCQACPLFSGQHHEQVGEMQPMQSRTDCLCFPGHDDFNTDDGCIGCAPHKTKIGFNNDSCAFCADGHAFTSSFQACVPCALLQVDTSRVHSLLVINSINVSLAWATSQYDCACELGHFRLQDQCHECAPGFFRNDPSAHSCTACALNSFASASASLACQACPAHSFTLSNASDAVESCVCQAGYEWNTTSLQCDACAPGSYGALDGGRCELCSNTTFANGSAQVSCDPCGRNEVAVLPRVSAASCVCAAGFGGPGECVACTAGSFSGGGSIALQRPACTICPDFKNTSTTQSTELQQCACIPGHGDGANDANSSAACALCVSGQYSSGGANIACKKCGYGAVTDPPLGAEKFEDCMCDARMGLLART